MNYKKGFTLIELLIVIAILGILAMAVLVGINPIDKINAANDSNVQGAVNSIANATEAYMTAKSGDYPVAGNPVLLQDALVLNGDMKARVNIPTGYTLTGSSTALNASLFVTLKSKKYVNAVPALNFWVWCSSNSKSGPNTTAACLP